MPYARPTLTQLRQQALQDVLDGGISNVSAVLRFSVITVITYALAGLAWLHYGYLDWIAKQAVPWTATDEYLAAWGALKGIYLKDATAASGGVTFTVTGDNIIPAGTTIILGGALSAITTADSITANGQTVAQAECSSTGTAGNIAAGSLATLSSPVKGVQTTGSVSTAFTGGADIETQDEFRSRVLDAYQNPGGYGTAADYKEWSEAVAGVTRAWVVPNGFGSGSVVIYVMMDDANAAEGGFPQGTDGASSNDTRYTTATGDQLTVANAVWEKEPATPLVVVCAPIAQATDFVISDLGSENTEANQALIKEALQDMFLRLSGPGVTIHENAWQEAIAAIGLSSYDITSPSGPIVPETAGSMPVLGTLTTES